ncbi:unnamed protein product [Aphanomyces euteiches]
MGGLTLFIVLVALCMWIRDAQHEQKLKETYHIDSIYHLQEPTQPHQSHQPEPLTTPFTQLLSGEVSLTHFEVKTDEVQALQLPVELKRLSVGKLRLQLPLVHLSTQAAQIELTDVNVLLGTPRNPQWDPTSLYVAEQSKIFVMQMLVEQFSPTNNGHNHHHNGTNRPANNPPSDSPPINPTLLKLLENCQVVVERIHIRFEDGLTGLGLDKPAKYALGVTLASLRVSHASPVGSSGAKEKMLVLDRLSVYLKEDEMLEDLSPDDQMRAFVAPFEPATHHGIRLLEPLSLDLKCQFNFDPISKIQLAIQVDVPVVQLNLAREHTQYLDCFLNHVDRFDRYSLYRRFRPIENGKMKKNYKAWWRYAILAVVMDLNDPVRRKPTWRSTLNLVLVSLQYTALRRQVAPYLIRHALPGDHHFLEFREDFEGCQSSLTPSDPFMASESLPKDVTHFGGGIFAGIYGLHRCFPRLKTTELDDAVRPAEPVLDDDKKKEFAKALWHRQLCIDAAFRPIVMAKLRFFASCQMDQKATAKVHNMRKGTLTLTLVDSHLAVPKSMLLFCKIKVGHNGTAYSGDLVQTDNSTTHLVFAQTFEFHLDGTANEDTIHVNVFDRWPLFNQFVGKFRLDLAAITAEAHLDQLVAIESADKKAQGMHMRILTVFKPEGNNNGGIGNEFASSEAMMAAKYTTLYASKPHTMHSWFKDVPRFRLESVGAKIHIGQVQLAFLFPKALDSADDDDDDEQVLLQLHTVQYHLQFVPARMKQTLLVARLEMRHRLNGANESIFFQGPRADSTAPFLEYEKETRAKTPEMMKIRTQDVDLVVDLPTFLRHVMLLEEKIPELSAINSLFNAPVYQAMMQYASDNVDDELGKHAKKSPKDESPISPRFSWMWAPERPANAPPNRSSSQAKLVEAAINQDCSNDFNANVEMGALYISLAGVQDKKGKPTTPRRVLEVKVPGMTLQVEGGLHRKTEVKSSGSTLVEMDGTVPRVLRQLDQIFHVLQRQLRVDAQPFYKKPLSSRAKARRFERGIHDLERQLAKYRLLLRQVVAAPETYGMAQSDCDELRLIVRDLQPKVVNASDVMIAKAHAHAFELALVQGITVIKHNVRKGDPSWRVLWLQDQAICLARPTERKKTRVLPLKNIAGVATGKMTAALGRTGDAKDVDKYIAIQIVDEPKPISLELQSIVVRDHFVATMTSLLTRAM